MMPASRWVVSVLISLAAAATCAAARHGGGGPPPPPQPPSRPGEGLGPPTAINPGAGRTATGPSTGGHSRTTGSGTGSRSRASSGGSSILHWEYWWDLNKEPYLVPTPIAATGAIDGTTAAAPGEPARWRNRPTFGDLRGDVLDALLAALADEDHHVVNSAALSIARSVPTAMAPLVQDRIVAVLASPHAPTREAATLALGLLGSPRAVPVLSELLNDTPRARAELRHNTERQSDLVRPFAAIALGLIGTSDAFPPLRAAAERPDGNQNLQACAITALGLLDQDRAEITLYLAQLLGRHDLPSVVQAQVPIAIARRGAAGRLLVPALMATLTSPKTHAQVTLSCIVALGKLASIDQAEVMQALENIAVANDDEAAANFAWIALGEVAARDTAFESNAAAHQTLARLFADHLLQPTCASELPWVALASGIHAHAHPRIAPLLPLARTYATVTNPSYKAAAALALGLAGFASSAPELQRDFTESRDRTLQGYLAIALGLLRAAPAAESIVSLIRVNGLDWRCRLDLSRALALLADTQAVPSLLSQLQAATSLTDAISIGFALGAMRDRSALPPLRKLMQDRGRVSVQRDYAALAIGLCAERTNLPQRSRITMDINYQALTPELTELIRIL
ncbi:MAG: HEAT repeat domain-containing protein [Planctomycetota bacterium]